MPHRGRLSLPTVLAFALSFGAGASASAHGLDAGHITVELDGGAVRIVATPRSASLSWTDASGDGLLDLDEVRASRAELRAAVDDAITLTDLEGRAPACSPTDVSTPGSGYSGLVAPSDHLRVTRICRFDEPPEGLLLRDAFAAEAPTAVEAFRRGREASERVVLSSDAPATLLVEQQAPARLETTAADSPAPDRTTDRVLLGGVLLGGVLLGGAGRLRRLVSDIRVRNQRKEGAPR